MEYYYRTKDEETCHITDTMRHAAHEIAAIIGVGYPRPGAGQRGAAPYSIDLEHAKNRTAVKINGKTAGYIYTPEQHATL